MLRTKYTPAELGGRDEVEPVNAGCGRPHFPRLFECRVPSLIFEGSEYSNTFFALTASKARYQCLLNLRDAGWEVEFKHIACRPCETLSMARLAAFAETAQKRGVPFARIGMRVDVDGRRGWIVNKNDSANFEVLFETGAAGSCHPHWKMKYFDRDGRLLYDSDAGEVPV